MKRILSALIVLSLVLQLGFVVSADEAKIIYELNTEELSEGSINQLMANATSSAKATVHTEAEGNYIAMRDNDLGVDLRFEPKANFDGVKTVSFDFRPVKGSKHPAMLYLDMAICLTLSPTPTHYNQGTVKTTGTLTDDQWVNITLVTDSSSKTFDLYTDGLCIAKDFGTRDGRAIGGDMQVKLMGKVEIATEFDFKNFKIYDGEVVPPLSDKIRDTMLAPERNLVDYANADARLDALLGNAVAMTVGNSMARVNNHYVNIDPDNVYVAPFITADGYTLIPTRFTTETIGCNVEVLSATSFRFSKDGTVMEINMGDKNAIINGQPVEMPTTPVIKHDRLFIPLRFAAETYGKNVFWDDRGLIIISDTPVVSEGQEDIIKPLISDIRSYTTIFGNKKYSDVNYSARQYRLDGFDGGQWGALDAAKRFMATVNRWTYVVSGDNVKAYKDQGLLQQGSLNANAAGEYAKLDSPLNATTYFLSGTPYQRADMVHGPNWGCVNNPLFLEEVKVDATAGIDNGLFIWQFDDWRLNDNYRLGGCHCKWCNDGFKEYLKNEATPEEIASLATQGITDVSDFDYVEWLKAQGITHENQYSQIQNTPVDNVRKNFMIKRIRQFHKDLVDYMKEYNGSDIFYSINFDQTIENISKPAMTYVNDLVDGLMGETHGYNTSADAIYATMLLSRGTGVENVISPLPKTESDKQLMYSAIPFTYATGQFMLVPWDDWLVGTTRYYASLEELGGTFELPREYPFLFDNYEIPETIGYIFDLDENPKIHSYALDLLNKGIPAKGLVHQDGLYFDYTFAEEKLKGLQAVVASGNVNLTEAEKAAIENSGAVYVSADDKDAIDWLENTYWTVRDSDDSVYTVLRTNQLYDNAPVVVHAVNYDLTEVKKNVEIELNNLWLPEGNTFKINVYKPGENYKTITASKGSGTTRVTIDSVDRWTILEICGENTVRREVAFDLGEGYNGIGIGTRISKDKAYGSTDSFTIVTYSEGINSTTFNDTTGTQDEIAYVYRRMDNSALKKSSVNAGFTSADGAFGVMVRDGIYSNARFAALMYDDTNGLRLARRAITNKAVVYTELGKTKPAYMKLEKEGKEYVAYISQDGTSYTEAGRIEISFDSPVGGVFAASPDGSRAECKVNSFIVSDGSFGGEEFKSFRLKYGNGTIENATENARLDVQLETTNYKNLTVDDVNVTFKSSDENVIKVTDNGGLITVGEGTATISAVARMGLKNISASLTIKVTPTNPVMFEEDFEGGKMPSYILHTTAGNPVVKNGALQAVTNTTGQECDMVFEFKQRNMPTVFEFDFKAKFGKSSPTTGARVIYANGAKALSLTADASGFNWFFGNEQTHIADIEENKWHHIKIEADYVNQIANVYIDGIKVVDKGAPRGAIVANGSVQIGGWRLGDDSCYEWDNFKIYFTDKISD